VEFLASFLAGLVGLDDRERFQPPILKKKEPTP
jgi:hypothetical protein